MGVSSNAGTPKWLAYIGKPYWNGRFGRYPRFRKLPCGFCQDWKMVEKSNKDEHLKEASCIFLAANWFQKKVFPTALTNLRHVWHTARQNKGYMRATLTRIRTHIGWHMQCGLAAHMPIEMWWLLKYVVSNAIVGTCVDSRAAIMPVSHHHWRTKKRITNWILHWRTKSNMLTATCIDLQIYGCAEYGACNNAWCLQANDMPIGICMGRSAGSGLKWFVHFLTATECDKQMTNRM